MLEFRIEEAGIRELSFQLPAALREARISAPLLRRKIVAPVEQDATRVLVKLELQDEVMGQFRVLVESDRLLTGDSQRAPIPTVETGRTDQRFVTLETSGRDEVLFDQQEGVEPLTRQQEAWARLDAVVLVIGETSSMSGEAASRSSLALPGAQEELFQANARLGKPLVVVLMNGRPLAIPGVEARAPAVLETWFGGVEGGNAVADILFGDVDPSGKLPVTFPVSVGQVPLYYNHKNTGRPPSEVNHYTSKYIDLPHTPLYPFEYGLSYAAFAYRSLQVQPGAIRSGEAVRVSVEVESTGDRSGEEVVQLYVTDPVATVTRPVKELKQFRRIALAAGEKQTVTFTLGPDQLAMYDAIMHRVVEPGLFRVMVGGNSRDVLTSEFVVLER